MLTEEEFAQLAEDDADLLRATIDGVNGSPEFAQILNELQCETKDFRAEDNKAAIRATVLRLGLNRIAFALEHRKRRETAGGN